MKCDKCGSENITYYKQLRKDGVWVVTARCDRGHHPTTGKPFYPVMQFDLKKLPILGKQETQQPELFSFQARDFIEERKKISQKTQSMFPRIK